MTKLLVFLGGAAAGFAVCAKMTEDQRQKTIGRARRVSTSPTVEKLSDSVHTVTGAVADVATEKVQAAADKVASVVGADQPADRAQTATGPV